VRSFHAPGAYAETVVPIVRENISRESRLHTDESPLYKKVGKEFAAHETVKHSDYEYVRGDVTTNTVESYFSVFKRGMRGVYQHCKEKHLHRYLAEYDFQIQSPHRPWRNRWRTCGACREGCDWQASHVSGNSLVPTSECRRGAFCAGERKCTATLNSERRRTKMLETIRDAAIVAAFVFIAAVVLISAFKATKIQQARANSQISHHAAAQPPEPPYRPSERADPNRSTRDLLFDIERQGRQTVFPSLILVPFSALLVRLSREEDQRAETLERYTKYLFAATIVLLVATLLPLTKGIYSFFKSWGNEER
jgi:hypothetical protein